MYQQKKHDEAFSIASYNASKRSYSIEKFTFPLKVCIVMRGFSEHGGCHFFVASALEQLAIHRQALCVVSGWSKKVGMILGEEIRIFEVKGQHKIAHQKSSVDRSWTLTLDQKFWFPSGMSIGDVAPHFVCVWRSMHNHDRSCCARHLSGGSVFLI